MDAHPDEIIEAELTWTGDTFQPGVQVAVSKDGRIGAVGRGLGAATRELAGQALVPGFVNAHSHAFQRGLRGAGERFPAGVGSFWSWREEMYQLVERLDAAATYELSKRAFDEMRACGSTTVGEFHYLRHAGDTDYALDEAVLRAARDAG
ncbi:MAG: amidohydrolase family protein, partial [Planctomycetota bacterium]